jgi:hypothetical protein
MDRLDEGIDLQADLLNTRLTDTAEGTPRRGARNFIVEEIRVLSGRRGLLKVLRPKDGSFEEVWRAKV